jgi:AsmA protein
MAPRTPPRLGPEPRLSGLEPRQEPRAEPRLEPRADANSNPSPYDDEGLPRVVTGKVRSSMHGNPTAARSSYHRPDDDDDGEGRSIGKIILVSVVALGALAAAAVAAVTIFLPVDLIRDQVIAEFKAKTGRDLVISGKTSFSIYPDVAVALNKVAVSAPANMGGGPTIEIEAVEASVKLWPLLSRDVVVDKLSLRRPIIDLRIDAQGRRSWDFAETLPPVWPHDRPRYAQAAGTAAPKELRDFASGTNPNAAERRPTSAKLGNLSLSDVRLIDGLLRYTDDRSGASEEVALTDLTVSLTAITSPLIAKGSIDWRGENLSFAGRITPFRAVLDEQPAHVVISAMGRAVEAAFDGNALMGRTPSLDGRLTAKSSSVANLSAWLGKPLIGGSADGPLDMAAFTETRLGFEKTTATGTLTVDTKGTRPHLKGQIRLTDLDLDRLAAIKPGQARAVAPARRVSTPASADAAPQSIEDLLKEKPPGAPARAPQVRGYTRQTGWSNDALDFSGLGLFDADLRVGFGTVSWHAFKTGNGQLLLALKDRKARITVEDIQLYDGKARGIVTLDGTAATTIIGANLTAEGVTALPFLKDTANFDWLSGRARVHLAVGAQGQSERQIIQTLNGKAEISMAEGALVGINIPQILRNAAQGRLSGLQRVATEKTDFSEMAATFQITGGIAQNQDLRIISPQFRVTGAGAVNIPGGQVDYLVKPKLTAAPAAANSQTPNAQTSGAPAPGINLASLEVPVKIQGPWEKPSIAPDLNAVLRDPGQAIEAVKEIGKNLRGSEVESTVKGLLSNDPEQKKKAKDLLNQFLKR